MTTKTTMKALKNWQSIDEEAISRATTLLMNRFKKVQLKGVMMLTKRCWMKIEDSLEEKRQVRNKEIRSMSNITITCMMKTTFWTKKSHSRFRQLTTTKIKKLTRASMNVRLNLWTNQSRKKDVPGSSTARANYSLKSNTSPIRRHPTSLLSNKTKVRLPSQKIWVLRWIFKLHATSETKLMRVQSKWTSLSQTSLRLNIQMFNIHYQNKAKRMNNHKSIVSLWLLRSSKHKNKLLITRSNNPILCSQTARGLLWEMHLNLWQTSHLSTTLIKQCRSTIRQNSRMQMTKFRPLTGNMCQWLLGQNRWCLSPWPMFSS